MNVPCQTGSITAITHRLMKLGDLIKNIKKYSMERWKALTSLDMSRYDVAHIFMLVVLILLGIATYYVIRKG